MPETEVVRKLTTIMAADVVGYSRLMTEDEEGTLKTFRGYRKVIDGLITRHGGRIFNTAGDAVLAEFNSAVEGVRCTISIQEELTTRNAQLPEDKRLMLRIGINVGDVMINGDDLMGDGVNVAARLEALAEPGGICISSSTFEQVKNKLSVSFQDMGPQDVKNIPYPVGAFQIMAGPVSVIPDEAPADGPPPPHRPTVNVKLLALLLVVPVLAAVWFLTQTAQQPAPLTALPATVSTSTMNAEEIRTLVSSRTIVGTSERTQGAFTIRLHPDGQAEIVMAGNPDTGFNGFRETGQWWASDRLFCMQFKRFGFGERRCPVFARENDRLVARRRDGQLLNWSLSP